MTFQYTIERKIKNAPWFILHTCNSLDDVLRDLDQLIKSDIRYKRIYFVYNDFYKNVYLKMYQLINIEYFVVQ